MKIIQKHDYPAGDIQNEPLFWIATGSFLIAISVAAILVSVRELRKGDVELPPYLDSRDIHLTLTELIRSSMTPDPEYRTNVALVDEVERFAMTERTRLGAIGIETRFQRSPDDWLKTSANIGVERLPHATAELIVSDTAKPNFLPHGDSSTWTRTKP